MIATTAEQGKHLVELGMDRNSADMFYRHDGETLKPRSELINDIKNVEYPAWSLSALLNYLREVDFFPEIEANEFDVIMSVCYYDIDEAKDKSLCPIRTHTEVAETFVEAAYKLVAWVLEDDD